jgi:hypothetical protein
MLEKLKLSTWIFWLSVIICVSILLILLTALLKIDYVVVKILPPILYGGYYGSPYIVAILIIDFICNKSVDRTKCILAIVLNTLFFFGAREIFMEIAAAITMI